MRRSRFLPDLIILGLWLGALGWIWFGQDVIRQQKVLQSTGATLIMLLLMLLRFVFFSRLGWKARLGGLGAAIAAVAGMMWMFEIRGVTGDLVPLLALRWQPEAGAADSNLPALPPQVTVKPTASSVEPEPPLASDAADPGETLQESAHEESVPPAPELQETQPDQEDPGTESPTPQSADIPAAPSPAPSEPAPSARPSTDFPQFLGPNRDGTLPDLHLASDWDSQPPRLLWKRGIGAGWSGFGVAGSAAVTQEQRDEDELIVRYDLETGEPVWVHGEAARYGNVVGGVGPRATPTIADGAVFAMGATGILTALDLETGELLWRHDLRTELRAPVPEWGKSCSPLVLGDQVIVSAGAPSGHSLVAFDRSTGELLWAAGNDISSYSSPFLTTLAGREQIVIFNHASVAGHDPADGRILWQFSWPAEQPNVSQPVVLGPDRLFVSSGYGIGGKVLKIQNEGDAQEASLVWETPRLKAKFTNVVFHEGYLYGLDDGILVCLDPETGERCWKRGRYGHGQVLLVGELLLVQTERGAIILVDPNPDELTELARFEALDGKVWNPPTLAGSKLLLRNHKEMALYELPLAAP